SIPPGRHQLRRFADSFWTAEPLFTILRPPDELEAALNRGRPVVFWRFPPRPVNRRERSSVMGTKGLRILGCVCLLTVTALVTVVMAHDLYDKKTPVNLAIGSGNSSLLAWINTGSRKLRILGASHQGDGTTDVYIDLWVDTGKSCTK